MCQVCFDALIKNFPLDPDGEGMYVLWNETAFPFADGEHTAKQLREARFKRDNYLLPAKRSEVTNAT